MLLRKLKESGILDNYIDVLDWMFDDNKFDVEHGWSKGKVSKFTSKIKNYLEKIDCDYSFDEKNIVLLSKPKNSIVRINNSGSAGKNLVRNIRNGIAHRNFVIYYANKKMFFQTYDVTKNKKEKPVCSYIVLPIESLIEIYDIYLEIKNSINNERHLKKRSSKKVM